MFVHTRQVSGSVGDYVAESSIPFYLFFSIVATCRVDEHYRPFVKQRDDIYFSIFRHL